MLHKKYEFQSLFHLQRDAASKESESRIEDLEKQLAEIKQTSQQTGYEKEQQIMNLKADLDKVWRSWTVYWDWRSFRKVPHE